MSLHFLGDFWFWVPFIQKSVKFRDMQPSINSRLQHHEQQAKETKISLWGQFEKKNRQTTYLQSSKGKYIERGREREHVVIE